jgi:hypothetical protein
MGMLDGQIRSRREEQEPEEYAHYVRRTLKESTQLEKKAKAEQHGKRECTIMCTGPCANYYKPQCKITVQLNDRPFFGYVSVCPFSGEPISGTRKVYK